MPIEWPVIGADTGWAAFLVLAFLVVRAIVKGDLVPRSTHEREVESAQHDAQEWRTEGRIKDQVIAEKLDQAIAIGEESGKTMHHFLGDLRAAGGIAPKRKGGQS